MHERTIRNICINKYLLALQKINTPFTVIKKRGTAIGNTPFVKTQLSGRLI
ncbi:hypothetical protein EZMO1_0676 [Endozoicomonas montiporae CL-33]|uniref:Uncharacterized protein n=1 Tax=Endozoicomonas montiporae CL-33 TaxID=570277 RepID=A0A142B839_9GAMM|nr:hypothetical protein EZMO1_0676 [Endozoicomonas montiporae CL-33]